MKRRLILIWINFLYYKPLHLLKSSCFNFQAGKQWGKSALESCTILMKLIERPNNSVFEIQFICKFVSKHDPFIYQYQIDLVSQKSDPVSTTTLQNNLFTIVTRVLSVSQWEWEVQHKRHLLNVLCLTNNKLNYNPCTVPPYGQIIVIIYLTRCHPCTCYGCAALILHNQLVSTWCANQYNDLHTYCTEIFKQEPNNRQRELLKLVFFFQKEHKAIFTLLHVKYVSHSKRWNIN